MRKILASAGLAFALLGVAAPTAAQEKRETTEPKKLKSAKSLKPGEGALQISVRTQKQFIETAIVYFVALDASLSDTNRVYRFERGAGVPIMGSNMIDEKPVVYRMPPGRYRALAFTVACDAMPFAEGLTCMKGYGTFYPTGFFSKGEALFEVEAGKLTSAGDFIIEYTGPKPDTGVSLFDVKDTPVDWGLRWRVGTARPTGFENLDRLDPTVPQAMHSRITCDARPQGVSLYIPFDC